MNNYIFLLFATLLVATLIDLKLHRIPNILSLGLVATGLFFQIYAKGFYGLWTGTSGVLVGLIGFLPFYLGGGMGAGDVKLMAAVGTFLGPMNTLLAACLTLITGGVMALMILIARKGAGAFLQRYGQMLRHLLATGQAVYIPPQPGDAAASRFPYAAAITVGTFATLIWQAP
ncbi:MAG: prepilin peptidase CpaA [Pseudomonadota bacterium]|nr:prepilin peptidase CpaA [Pseudomonadota bacterium]